jgi:hypothetical protein
MTTLESPLIETLTEINVADLLDSVDFQRMMGWTPNFMII